MRTSSPTRRYVPGNFSWLAVLLGMLSGCNTPAQQFTAAPAPAQVRPPDELRLAEGNVELAELPGPFQRPLGQTP